MEKSSAPMVNEDGRYERLQKKLESFKVNNLNAKELELLKQKIIHADEYARSFSASFIKLSWDLMGISQVQLAQMTEEELFDLEDLYIAERVRKCFTRYLFLVLSNPVGWIVGLCHYYDAFRRSDSAPLQPVLRYSAEKRRLRKIYGKDYFPAKKILEMVKSAIA